MRKMMTKTNGKYTYGDLLLRKRILKHEINEFEKLITFEDVPKTLGAIGGTMKGKAINMIQNPGALSMVMDASMGLGAERFISKFVNKKSIGGKIVLAASAYLIPMAIPKAKEWIGKKASESMDDKSVSNSNNYEIGVDRNNTYIK